MVLDKIVLVVNLSKNDVTSITFSNINGCEKHYKKMCHSIIQL